MPFFLFGHSDDKNLDLGFSLFALAQALQLAVAKPRGCNPWAWQNLVFFPPRFGARKKPA